MTTNQKFIVKIDGQNEEFSVIRTLANGSILAHSQRYGQEVFEAEELTDCNVECACGHIAPHSMVMHSSTGTCCPACYDRMSE